MRFLANENFPGDAVAALRERGHDVTWIRTEAPGRLDPDVLARAQTENRILLTFDKDFGELAFRTGLPASSGVILFRISAPSPAHVTRVIVGALDSRTDWPAISQWSKTIRSASRPCLRNVERRALGMP